MPEDDPGEGTGTEDAPHAMGWVIGSHWGPADGPARPDPAPEYIAEDPEPSEADWAHEEELYLEKNGRRPPGK